jgi:hypothetical protein
MYQTPEEYFISDITGARPLFLAGGLHYAAGWVQLYIMTYGCQGGCGWSSLEVLFLNFLNGQELD